MPSTWNNKLTSANLATIQNIIDDIDDLSGDLSTYWDALKVAIDGLKPLIYEYSDPVVLAARLVLDAVDGLLNDLKEGSVYTMVAATKKRGGLAEFEQIITESFNDAADIFRPMYNDTDQAGGFIIAFGAPTIQVLQDNMNVFRELFWDGDSVGLLDLGPLKKWDRYSEFFASPRTGYLTKAPLVPGQTTIELASGAGLPRRGGNIIIVDPSVTFNVSGDPVNYLNYSLEDGVQETTYSKCSNTSGRYVLSGLQITKPLDAFSRVYLIRNAATVKPLAFLRQNYNGSQEAKDILVEDLYGITSIATMDFPESGTLLIGNERVIYDYKRYGYFYGIMQNDHVAGEPVTLISGHPGMAKEPNWNRTKIVDFIPGLSGLYSLLEGVAEFIAPASAIQDMVDDIVALITAKVNDLTVLYNSLQNLFNDITTALDNFTARVLAIPFGAGGVTYLKQELQGASDKPAWPDGYIVAGIMVVTGSSASYALLGDLFEAT